MSKQVTLDLPEALYEHARRWATIIRRDVDETLTEALNIVLTPKYTTSELENPISDLSDDEILALSKAKMKDRNYWRLCKCMSSCGYANQKLWQKPSNEVCARFS